MLIEKVGLTLLLRDTLGHSLANVVEKNVDYDCLRIGCRA